MVERESIDWEDAEAVEAMLASEGLGEDSPSESERIEELGGVAIAYDRAELAHAIGGAELDDYLDDEERQGSIDATADLVGFDSIDGAGL